MLYARLLIFHLQFREGIGLTGKEVGYADVNETDIREEILSTTGTGLLPLLHEIELHLTTLHSLHHEVLYFQTATNNSECLAGRRSQQLLVYSIIEIETDDGVSTRSELQFFTSQTILSIL